MPPPPVPLLTTTAATVPRGEVIERCTTSPDSGLVFGGVTTPFSTANEVNEAFLAPVLEPEAEAEAEVAAAERPAAEWPDTDDSAPLLAYDFTDVNEFNENVLNTERQRR